MKLFAEVALQITTITITAPAFQPVQPKIAIIQPIYQEWFIVFFAMMRLCA